MVAEAKEQRLLTTKHLGMIISKKKKGAKMWKPMTFLKQI